MSTFTLTYPSSIFNIDLNLPIALKWVLSRIWQAVSDLVVFAVSCVDATNQTPDNITRHQEDTVWVERCKSGDQQAFEPLVYRYQDMIYNLCLRMLGNREDGEDAAQEAFVKAYEGMEEFKGESAFATWLFRIATNVCRNRQTSFWGRLSRRAIRLDKQQTNENGDSHQWELPSPDGTPEEDLARKHTAQNVRNALDRLPAKHREIIVLADIQELSYEEIQTITRLELGTIKSRLARAREALRQMMTAGNL